MADDIEMELSGFETDGWWAYEGADGDEGGGGNAPPTGSIRWGRIPGTVAAGALTGTGSFRRFGKDTTFDPELVPVRGEHFGLGSRDPISKRLEAWDFQGRFEYYPTDASSHVQITDALTRAMGSSLSTTDDGKTKDPWGGGYAPQLRAHPPTWYWERKIARTGSASGTAKSYLLSIGCKTQELTLDVSPPNDMKCAESAKWMDSTYLVNPSASKAYLQTLDQVNFSGTNYFGNTVGAFAVDQYAGGDVTGNVTTPADPGELAATYKPYRFFECGIRYAFGTIGDTYATQKTNVDAGSRAFNLRRWKWGIRNSYDARRAPNSLTRRFVDQFVPGRREIWAELSLGMVDEEWNRQGFKDSGMVTLKFDLGTSGKFIYCRNGIIDDPKMQTSEASRNETSVRVVFVDSAKTRNHVTVE